MGHADFVAHQTDSLGKSVDGGHWSNGEVLVNVVFERSESFRLVSDPVLFRINNLFVVETVLNLKYFV